VGAAPRCAEAETGSAGLEEQERAPAMMTYGVVGEVTVGSAERRNGIER
jgi:hypothetical protein